MIINISIVEWLIKHNCIRCTLQFANRVNYRKDLIVNTEQIIALYAEAPLTFIDIVSQKITAKRSKHTFVSSDQVSGLIIPLAGSAIFRIENEVYCVEPGVLLHVGPGLEMERYVTGNLTFEFAVIHFNLPKESAIHYPQFYKHFLLEIEFDLKINNLVQQLLHNSLIPGRITYLHSKGLFLKILEEMLLANEKSHQKKLVNLDEVTQYMHHYYGHGISAIDVADHFKTDRRELSTLFMKKVGVSPTHYLTELRIREAKLLLKTSKLTIAEIAEAIGYKDHFYFSRVFKKETGFPPRDYRKRME